MNKKFAQSPPQATHSTTNSLRDAPSNSPSNPASNSSSSSPSNSTSPPHSPSLSLEKALAELEAIVKRLESGEDELATAFNLYEQAEKIVLHTYEKLSTFEEKLRVINQKGDIALQPLLSNLKDSPPNPPSQENTLPEEPPPQSTP